MNKVPGIWGAASLGGMVVSLAWPGCNAGSTLAPSLPSDAGSDWSSPDVFQPPDAGSDIDASRDTDGDDPVTDSAHVPPDAEADGEIPAWDPVWHMTEPAQWPAVPGGDRPDCGPGCKTIAWSCPLADSRRAPHATERWVGFQGWTSGKFDDGSAQKAIIVDMRDPSSPLEFVLDDGSWLPNLIGAGGVAVDGDVALYVVGSRHDGYIMLANLITGEKKYVWRVPKKSASEHNYQGTSSTYLALPYAYWVYSGDTPEAMFRFDVRDGSLKMSFDIGACDRISGTSTGIGACSATSVGLVLVDFDTNTSTLLPTTTQYRSTMGMISVDGKEATWIDFRDPGPKGEHGYFDFPWGGEVYHLDMETGKEDRLTFDTPDHPTMKTMPWASHGDMAWITRAETNYPNPEISMYWYEAGGLVVKRAGEASRQLLQRVGYPRPTRQGVVANWLGEDATRIWTILVDWPKTDSPDAGR